MRTILLCSTLFVPICSLLYLGGIGSTFVDEAIGAVNESYHGTCTCLGEAKGGNGYLFYGSDEKDPVELTMALDETTSFHGNNHMLKSGSGSFYPDAFLGFSYGQIIYDGRQDGLSLIMNVGLGLGTDISAKELGAKASLGFQW